jgi:hypothetical protein
LLSFYRVFFEWNDNKRQLQLYNISLSKQLRSTCLEPVFDMLVLRLYLPSYSKHTYLYLPSSPLKPRQYSTSLSSM